MSPKTFIQAQLVAASLVSPAFAANVALLNVSYDLTWERTYRAEKTSRTVSIFGFILSTC